MLKVVYDLECSFDGKDYFMLKNEEFDFTDVLKAEAEAISKNWKNEEVKSKYTNEDGSQKTLEEVLNSPACSEKRFNAVYGDYNDYNKKQLELQIKTKNKGTIFSLLYHASVSKLVDKYFKHKLIEDALSTDKSPEEKFVPVPAVWEPSNIRVLYTPEETNQDTPDDAGNGDNTTTEEDDTVQTPPDNVENEDEGTTGPDDENQQEGEIEEVPENNDGNETLDTDGEDDVIEE